MHGVRVFVAVIDWRTHKLWDWLNHRFWRHMPTDKRVIEAQVCVGLCAAVPDSIAVGPVSELCA